jgi:hypothetical protein
MPEIGTQCRDLFDGSHTVGVHLDIRGGPGGKCNFQPAGIGSDFLQKRPLGRRCSVRIAHIGPGSGIEQCGAVSNGPGYGVFNHQPAEHVAKI